MGVVPGADVVGSVLRPTPGTPREPPLEQQYKKHSRTAVPCSVCGKIIPAKLAIIQDNKVYCKECFKRTPESARAELTPVSGHMIR